jgi:hypothetical protein
MALQRERASEEKEYKFDSNGESRKNGTVSSVLCQSTGHRVEMVQKGMMFLVAIVKII